MMKGWGWGDPEFEFSIADRPQCWPWIVKTLDLTTTRSSAPVRCAEICLKASVRNDGFCRALAARLKPDQVADTDDKRLLHEFLPATLAARVAAQLKRPVVRSRPGP
jgi:hypothetical protein